jgi:hypothetical protein
LVLLTSTKVEKISQANEMTTMTTMMFRQLPKKFKQFNKTKIIPLFPPTYKTLPLSSI